MLVVQGSLLISQAQTARVRLVSKSNDIPAFLRENWNEIVQGVTGILSPMENYVEALIEPGNREWVLGIYCGVRVEIVRRNDQIELEFGTEEAAREYLAQHSIDVKSIPSVPWGNR